MYFFGESLETRENSPIFTIYDICVVSTDFHEEVSVQWTNTPRQTQCCLCWASVYEPLIQICFNVGPPSSTSAQPWINCSCLLGAVDLQAKHWTNISSPWIWKGVSATIKWQIHPFISKGTKYQVTLVLLRPYIHITVSIYLKAKLKANKIDKLLC